MRSPRDNVIITCAVTGNLTTPEQTPHLPITPEQIADACLRAADAGAAIVHIHMRDLLADGTLQGPVLCSFVMGVRYGFQPTPETVLYARELLPHDAEFTAVGIGKAAFTSVAQSYLAGGHVRVGLEDSVYLSRGRLATSNAEMVVKARRIVEDLGGTIATVEEARRIVGLSAYLANSAA